MKTLIITIFLSLSTFAIDKKEVAKENFYDSFYMKRLALARKSISSHIKKYNHENKNNRFLETDSGYILKKDPYEIRFSYVDIIFKRIFINNREFELLKDEDQKSLKKRLRKIRNKKIRRQTFINFLSTNAYAASEEAFDAILMAVMNLTNFSDSFWDSSIKDQAKNMLEQIVEQRDQCLDYKASGEGDTSSFPNLDRFIISVLYASNKNDLETFKKKVNRIIVEDSGLTSSAEEKLAEKVKDLRGCSSLGYLVGEEVLELNGNLLNEKGNNLNNISLYSGKQIETSTEYMANFCQAFEELASCVADVNIYHDGRGNFSRDQKEFLREAAEDKGVRIYKSGVSR